MEYFKLVKWMIFLNLLLCLPMIFIIVPQIVMSPRTFEGRFAETFQDVTPAGLVQTGEYRHAYVGSPLMYCMMDDTVCVFVSDLRVLSITELTEGLTAGVSVSVDVSDFTQVVQP